ncbi:Lamina-associated polypeptide 2, isoform alpha [Labeo rohita]|uniref:Lamina-associated polypeptide 2, isoform alpha n=1 Tax=Labeo rohita TaxID=84645 RepID=A0ABQ8L449_LABRO|nr:Lamina-associated polypeptide 2, isoform alpha [Labeo rohita]
MSGEHTLLEISIRPADSLPSVLFPFEELELRPLEVAIGESLLRDPCLKLYTKTTRYWPATAYDVTAGTTRRCWCVIPARRKLSLWGSQVDLADKLDKGLSLSRSSAGNESELLDGLIRQLEEQELLDEEKQSEPSQSSCPTYEELLEVVERATARLDLPWKRMKKVAPRGHLDEHFLSDHNPPAQVSLPFLPDLHSEVVKAWSKPFSSHIHRFQQTSYANIEGMRKNGYERMPPIEEKLASYLSLGEAFSLKAPSLPTEPLQKTSSLNGRAYAVAGQAVASLHTMAVLQAYQADLLKDLDKGQGLSPDEVAELRRTTDLALRATKQAATAMGRSMAAMAVTERHLWVNLADLGRREKGFLLDVPVSPSELFGTSVETVIEKFREAKARSAAFKTFIPRWTRSEREHQRGPGPSRSEDRRQAQKASVAVWRPEGRSPGFEAGGSGEAFSTLSSGPEQVTSARISLGVAHLPSLIPLLRRSAVYYCWTI